MFPENPREPGSPYYPGAPSGPELYSLMVALFEGTGGKIQVKTAVGFQEAMGTER